MVKMIKRKELTSRERERLTKKVDDISMPLRWKKIFKSRYGLEDGITKSNPQVGKKFKVSGEAIRQILAKVEKLIA